MLLSKCIMTNQERLWVFGCIILTRLCLSVFSSWHPALCCASNLREEQGKVMMIASVDKLSHRAPLPSREQQWHQWLANIPISSEITGWPVLIRHWRLSASFLLLSSCKEHEVIVRSNKMSISITMHIMWNEKNGKLSLGDDAISYWSKCMVEV